MARPRRRASLRADVTPVHERTPGVRLNESQHRALSITLRLLEQRLATISDLIEREEGGILYRRPRPGFSADQSARVESLMSEIRDQIRRAAETFDVPCEERDAQATIVAVLAMSWQRLGEIDARGMRAYGETDPGLAGVLDPIVRTLMDLLIELESTVARAR
jgi:hypothetical protein